MKQRIEIRLIVASSRHKLNIKSVYEIEGKLIVISEHQHRGGWGHDDYCTISDACIVNTSGKKELSIVNYLTGNTKEEIATGDDAATKSINCPYGSNPTQFIPITDESQIADLLAKGKRIFTPRKDGLNAVRLGHIERAASKPLNNLLPMDDHAASITLSTEQLQDTLNIYPIVVIGIIYASISCRARVLLRGI